MFYEPLWRAVSRHRREWTRWLGRSALYGAATFALVEAVRAPSPIVVRPAAEAVTTPVFARSNVVPVAYLSSLPRTPPSPWPTRTTSPASAKPTPPAPKVAKIANPRVDTWAHRFTTSLKNEFTSALERGSVFDGMISSKLAARHMPHELFYLALIESDFRPTARSRASAVGLWQFMAGTARRFGLSVGRRADDRKNPAKETDAALAYLSELHAQFGSWYLAAAAYNAGPGAVTRALVRTTGRTTGSDADFYRISPRLPRETRDYVPKWIAAARVAMK